MRLLFTLSNEIVVFPLLHREENDIDDTRLGMCSEYKRCFATNILALTLARSLVYPCVPRIVKKVEIQLQFPRALNFRTRLTKRTY